MPLGDIHRPGHGCAPLPPNTYGERVALVAGRRMLNRGVVTESLWLATDRGIKTMLGMSLVTWVMCRRSFFERKAAIDSIMKRNEMNENQTKVVLD